MSGHRWLGVALAIGVAAAIASCKKSGASSGAGGGSASSSQAGTGGMIGVGGGALGGSGGGTQDAGPIICTAQYSNVKGGACDLLQQDCPAGQTCTAVPSGASVTTTCVGASGIKGPGEACYAADECDAKLICIGSPGKCVAFCCPDMAAQPCNGGLCNTHVTLDQSGTHFAYVCSYGKRCTLLAPDACPPGLNCYVEDVMQGLAVCDQQSPSPAHELGACTYLNDCDNMESCYHPPGFASGVCLYYCDLSGPGTGAAPGLGGCPTGESCKSSYQGQTIDTGVSGIGLCVPNGGIVQPDGG